MAGPAFLDTNVLVYAVDRDELAKRDRARQLLASDVHSLVLSPQVLGEFYVVATRKLRRPVPEPVAARLVEHFSRLRSVVIDWALVRSAIAISQESGTSYWDGLIVAAARVAGCRRLITEDLSHDVVIAGVRVENPFR